MVEPRKNDRVTGWFGTGVITDIGGGFLVDQATDKPYTDVDDLIRIEQHKSNGDPVYTYIYKKDIRRNLTAEGSVLRA